MSMPVIKKVSYTAKEPYSAIETYYEEELYTEIIQVPLAYEVIKEFDYRIVPCPHPYDRVTIWLEVTIKNTDTEPGNFTSHVTFDMPPGKIPDTITESDTWLINPGHTHTLGCSVDMDKPFDIPMYTAYIEPGKKNIGRKSIRNVPKEKSVTKYRDVIEYKYISAFEYLMQEGA